MGEHRCKAVLPDRWVVVHCNRRATVEENGQWWCKTHAPSAVEARRAKSEAMLKATLRQARETVERRAAVYAACAGVDDPQPGELAALRAEVARWKEKA